MKKILLFLLISSTIYATKINDITNVIGVRDNHLIGYSLVVGLKKTGDGTTSKLTLQSISNMLRAMNVDMSAVDIKSKNVATVMVTATLPPFSRQGDKLKLEVSSIGDAKSIDKGKLLLTQLKGINGQVYAIGQGTVVGSNDNPTTGYIYDGATVENEIDFSLQDEKDLTISLLKQSATNASLIERKINDKFQNQIAQAIDTRTIKVIKPLDLSMVSFIAQIENININSDYSKKIIIDVAKKLVVEGADITIKPVTVSRDNFTLRIKNNTMSDEQWADPIKNTGIDIGDDVKIGNKPVEINLNNALINTKNTPTISDLMRAMKLMKFSINDIIETIQILKNLGAIEAQIEIVR